MNISGLGLAQGDPCYDPNHPWYDWGLESIWNTPAECACMAANPDAYPIGQQCASVQGVAQVSGNVVGGVVGGAASVVGEGLGTGIATGIGGFAQSVNFSGIMFLAIAGGVVYMLSKR